jgi:phosphocarrier protein
MADKLSVELMIQNERGLHARAAANFVKAIEDLDADVEVERLGQTVGGLSIMGLMMLAAAKGTTIKISATGNEAELAIKNLTDLINNKFGEEK